MMFAGAGFASFFSDFFADSPGLAVFDPAIFGEAIRAYPVFFAFVAFWFGCCIGSFLNVCVYRLPLGMSLVRPPSHCTSCDHVITPIENIPIFSYLFLRGRCRWCHAPITPKYLFGELAVGLFYMASFAYVLYFRLPLPSMFLYFLTISVAWPAAWIDFRVRLIPNELTYSLLILGPIYHLVLGIHWDERFLDVRGFLISVVTAGLFGTLLTLFSWLGEKAMKREAFGLGDVKLIAGFSACLGALPTLWIMLAGSLIAVVFMPIYTIRHPKFRRRGFAFGPFLSVGLGLWLLFGIPLTDAALYPDKSLDISAIEFINDHSGPNSFLPIRFGHPGDDESGDDSEADALPEEAPETALDVPAGETAPETASSPEAAPSNA